MALAQRELLLAELLGDGAYATSLSADDRELDGDEVTIGSDGELIGADGDDRSTAHAGSRQGSTAESASAAFVTCTAGAMEILFEAAGI